MKGDPSAHKAILSDPGIERHQYRKRATCWFPFHWLPSIAYYAFSDSDQGTRTRAVHANLAALANQHLAMAIIQ